MRTSRRGATILVALALAAGAVGAVPAAFAAADAPASANHQPAEPAIDQFYPVLRGPAELAGYTVYEPIGVPKHVGMPVVVWANGGCRLSNEEHLTFLTEIAAHGFFVIASGAFDARFQTSTAPVFVPNALTTAIDWVMGKPTGADDVRRDLDTSKIAVMGQSCGGILALAAAGDPRVKSSAAWSGSSGFPGPNAAVMAALHSPTLWDTGGTTDAAYKPSIADYALVPSGVPAALIDNSAAGHIGVSHGTNDPTAAKAGAPILDQTLEVQASTLAVNWLDYTLNGETSAGAYFLGPNCGLCSLPNWTVQTKGF